MEQPPFPPGARDLPALSCIQTLLHARLLEHDIEVVSTQEMLDLGLKLARQGADPSELELLERLRATVEQGFEGCFESVEPDRDDAGGLLAPQAAAAIRVLDADILVTAREDLIDRQDSLGLVAVLDPRAWLELAVRKIHDDLP